jgi:RNA polymerase sigma-70 factor, ECF subfamily
VPEPKGEAVPVLSESRVPQMARSTSTPSLHFMGVVFEVLNARTNPPTACRRSSLILVKRPPLPAQNPENRDDGTLAVLHSVPLRNPRGRYLEFESFDEPYLDRLRSRDFATQEHFSGYFSPLIRIMLSSRLKSREAIEDVRQETFSRFFLALKDGKILQPERLGSFVLSICRNVVMEYYRSNPRSISSLDDDEQEKKDVPSPDVGPLNVLISKETEQKVRKILEELSERDRRLLREVFLEERDKDQVCRDFGVDREYLRVLLHRAKQAFKASYLRSMRNNPPDFSPT